MSTRAAVCKNFHQLAQSGLEVHRVTGRGYKLDSPLTLLDRSRILKLMGEAATPVRDRLHVLDEWIQPIVIWPGSVTSEVLHLTDVPVTLVK